MGQLITANEVISKAFIHSNIDPSLIKAEFVEVCQVENIEPILGKDLYNEIVTQNNSNTLSANNQTLLNSYIKPALAFFVARDILLHLAIRVTNKGVMINNGTESSPASREDRALLIERYKEQAESMSGKIFKYLEDNQTLYPLYFSVRKNTSFKGGIITY